MKLPTPQRGQPLDVSFINDIVTSINSLWDKIVVSASSYSSLWTMAGRKIVKSSETKIITGQVQVTAQTATANGSFAFSYTFDVGFAYPPIVTATVQNTNSTDFTKGLRVILTSISQSDVKGIVVFETASTANASESLNTYVNLIAVGIPV